VKKTPWIVGAATVCVVAVGGGGTAFAMSNEAQITAYGEESAVRVFSQPTVGDLLAAQGIEVKDTDLVTPGLDELVTDGIDIQVVQRTPVTITIDGVDQELLTTGDTVADALAETDYKAEGAKISPEPDTALEDTDGQVSVVTQKTVTFVGQYGKDTFDVTALTVGDAMEKVLGNIEDTDKADVPRDELLEDGETYTVKRIREKERKETEEIPFETKTVEDDSLTEGTTKTKTEGKAGETEKVFTDKVVDGEVTDSELVSEEVVSEPVTEVVLKGTKPAPEPEPEQESAPAQQKTEKRESDSKSNRSSDRSSSESSDSSSSSESSDSGNTGASAPAAASGGVWDRLAQCESGGNWSISTGNGFSGGLQFTKSTWLAFGGGKYAPVAHQATREQQIDIAKKVQAGQGWGAWPACTSKLGIR
jgi:uncharacterized protein YabE (DUF348 family)